MKCDMCEEEKLLFEAHTGVCIDCYNKYFNFHLKNNQLEEKVQNLEMSLHEAKDTADAFYKKLKVYKRALELACEKYINVDATSYVLVDNEDYFDKSDEQIQKETIDYFISQAKKELEEEDVKD